MSNFNQVDESSVVIDLKAYRNSRIVESETYYLNPELIEVEELPVYEIVL